MKGWTDPPLVWSENRIAMGLGLVCGSWKARPHLYKKCQTLVLFGSVYRGSETGRRKWAEITMIGWAKALTLTSGSDRGLSFHSTREPLLEICAKYRYLPSSLTFASWGAIHHLRFLVPEELLKECQRRLWDPLPGSRLEMDTRGGHTMPIVKGFQRECKMSPSMPKFAIDGG